jgi:hypothetical protein
MKRRLLVMIPAGIAAVLASALPASATSDNIGPASVVRHQWVNYTTGRTVTSGGTNIYVRKNEGPEMDVKWRRCAGGAQGNAVRLENHDPTVPHLIGSNFLSGTVFCLSAYSLGNNTNDEWTGSVRWNVTEW